MVRCGRATKVGLVVANLPSWINLDSVVPTEYKSGISLFTGWVVDLVGMRMIDCAYLEDSSLEDVESHQRRFVTLRASKVRFL